jgi:hypothetical protein
MFTSLLRNSNYVHPVVSPGEIFPEDPFGSGGSGNGIAIDDDFNLYMINALTRELIKCEGVTHHVDSIINYPVGFTGTWNAVDISWNNDRVCLLMAWTGGGLPSYQSRHWWVELDGFSTAIAFEEELPWVSSLGVSLSGIRSANIDAVNDLLVCNSVAYDGQYRNYLLIYNYPSMTEYQSGWHGRVPFSSNQPDHSFLYDPTNTRIWIVDHNVDQNDLDEFSYSETNGLSLITRLSTFDFTVRTIGKYGACLDPHGDMWFMGTETSVPYLNLIRRYDGISNTLKP